MPSIQFTNKQTRFKLKEQERIAAWVERVILMYHKFPGDIQYVFCDDNFYSDVYLVVRKKITLESDARKRVGISRILYFI